MGLIAEKMEASGEVDFDTFYSANTDLSALASFAGGSHDARVAVALV